MIIEEEDKIKLIKMIDNKLQMLEQGSIKIKQSLRYLNQMHLEMVQNSQLTEGKFIFSNLYQF
jgi:hypothetical protein